MYILKNIYVGKEAINKNKNGAKLYFAFLDIEKAYGSVDRAKMLGLLRHREAGENLSGVLQDMYRNNKIKFELVGIKTNWGSKQQMDETGVCGFSNNL